ncbi:MAG: hypothetical protein ACKO7Z_11155 [Cyanobacteriota bacterium]
MPSTLYLHTGRSFTMRVTHHDHSCLVCLDRHGALSLLRLASLGLGSAATASDDGRFAMELQAALLAALRDQLRSDAPGGAGSHQL